MIELESEIDDRRFALAPGESVLAAARRAGLPFASACNGRARCSTCRIRVTRGEAGAPPESETETALKARVGLGPEVRLACQFRPEAPVAFRRLVLDDVDLALADQLGRDPSVAGELREVAVMFFDVKDFTGISRRLPAHDVLFLLNRFLTRAEEILGAHGGLFDKSVGDGFLALFGAEGEPEAPLAAVAAALEILDEVDRAGPFMRRHYQVPFDARIGLDFGEALIGALGPAGRRQLDVIGEVANVASRVEQANKETGTRLLVTEALLDRVRPGVVAPRAFPLKLRGVGPRVLHEVTGLTPEGRARLDAAKPPVRRRGRTWERVAESADLPDGAVRVVPRTSCDLVLTRRAGRVHAFDNACPHLRWPQFGEAVTGPDGRPAIPAESLVDDDLRVVCRWHGATFDLLDGAVVAWCPLLDPEGRSRQMPYLGDISKNRAPLEVFPVREEDGGIWVASTPLGRD